MDVLILLARIRPGQAEPLSRRLGEINRDHACNPHIRFSDDRMTHFARWAILEDPDNGARLLFAANHDGTFEAYVAELLRTSPGLDQIWGACEGYPGRERFMEFARASAQQPIAPFYAFPDETVDSVRAKMAIRKHIEEFLDL